MLLRLPTIRNRLVVIKNALRTCCEVRIKKDLSHKEIALRNSFAIGCHVVISYSIGRVRLLRAHALGSQR